MALRLHTECPLLEIKCLIDRNGVGCRAEAYQVFRLTGQSAAGSLATWLTGVFGGGGIGLGWLAGLDGEAIIAGGVVLIVFLLVLLLLKSQIIAAVHDIKNAVEG